MAIEVLDGGSCVAMGRCEFTVDGAGPAGTWRLYGQGVRGILVPAPPNELVVVQLAEPLSPVPSGVDPALPRYTVILAECEGTVEGGAVPALQTDPDEIQFNVFDAGEGGGLKSFWFAVFQLPLPLIASADWTPLP